MGALSGRTLPLYIGKFPSDMMVTEPTQVGSGFFGSRFNSDWQAPFKIPVNPTDNGSIALNQGMIYPVVYI
jgi:hypothetical protein